jgi:hypothetical protein
VLEQASQQEDGAAVLECEAGLHACAARVRRLDDNGRAREARHHGVALRERPTTGLLAGPELRQHGGFTAEAILQRGIRLRVCVTQAGADDRDGAPPGLEGCCMGGGVNSRGEAADYDITGIDEPSGDRPSLPDAALRRSPRSDNRDGPLVTVAQRTSDEEDWGPVMNHAQVDGVCGIEDGDRFNSVTFPGEHPVLELVERHLLLVDLEQPVGRRAAGLLEQPERASLFLDGTGDAIPGQITVSHDRQDGGRLTSADQGATTEHTFRV